MNFYEASSTIMDKKETSMCLGSSFMSYGITYGLYKENAKFSELNGIYCIE